MEKAVEIKENAKIGIISLASQIENKTMTVNKAYKTAIENDLFEGSIGSFIETLKVNNLLTTEQSNEAQNQVKPKGIDKGKIVKFVAVGLLIYGAFSIYNSYKK